MLRTAQVSQIKIKPNKYKTEYLLDGNSQKATGLCDTGTEEEMGREKN